jgi:putative ABC transport system permease protein
VLRERNDVESVTELRTTAVKVGDRVTMAVGLAPEGLNKALNLGVADGSLTDFRDGTVLVSTNEARTHNLRVGDELTVTFSETGEHHLRVAGTYKRDTVVGAGYVVTLADFSKNVTSTLDDGILVSATPGTDVATWKGEVTEALAAYPNAHVHDPAGFTKERQAHVDQMLGLVSVLLLLAVVVAVLGVINTLALSVVERTRELGLLRAVGGSRRQVRGMVRRESVLMAVLGALAGIGLGTAAGVALARALASQGISSLSVPVPMLICYVAIAAIVGVFAAVGPARRASRIDVLKALAVD